MSHFLFYTPQNCPCPICKFTRTNFPVLVTCDLSGGKGAGQGECHLRCLQISTVWLGGIPHRTERNVKTLPNSHEESQHNIICCAF